MIVVDLGCAAHGQWDSPRWLEERFHPRVIYGFDPIVEEGTYLVNNTTVIVENKAAWTYDGELQFIPDGTASTLVVDGSPLLHETMWRDPRPRDGSLL